MSTLQIGLAIAGGATLAAVAAHGFWAARRNAPRQPTAMKRPSGLPDPVEPGFRNSVFDRENQSPLYPVRRPPMDSLLDVIATLTLEGAGAKVSGETAVAALPDTWRAGSKPFALEGFNLETQVWEMPAAGQSYAAFQTGVQLTNRSGPLNDIEFSEFVVKTQAFGDAVNATPDFPDMRDTVARARELDQFASTHDARLGFLVRAKKASWSLGYVQQNAASLGFIPGPIAGRMVLPGPIEALAPLVAMGFDAQAAVAEDMAQFAIREINLQLDVAQVDRGLYPYDRMRKAAQALARTMDGVVTDDNGQPLSEQTMDQIGVELQSLYDSLEQRDFAAGSALARRLFS
jgi:hypothetical protein